jgi:hypothetical protein
MNTMKRIAVFIIAGLVIGSVALAAEPIRLTSVDVTTGTNDTGTTTISSIYGYVDEIALKLPTGTAVTGTVAVVATQKSGATVTLASKTITATTIIRPRLDGTTSAGAVNSTNAPDRYLSWGDSVACTVTSANTTGLTWKVYIKACDK